MGGSSDEGGTSSDEDISEQLADPVPEDVDAAGSVAQPAPSLSSSSDEEDEDPLKRGAPRGARPSWIGRRAMVSGSETSDSDSDDASSGPDTTEDSSDDGEGDDDIASPRRLAQTAVALEAALQKALGHLAFAVSCRDRETFEEAAGLFTALQKRSSSVTAPNLALSARCCLNRALCHMYLADMLPERSCGAAFRGLRVVTMARRHLETACMACTLGLQHERTWELLHSRAVASEQLGEFVRAGEDFRALAEMTADGGGGDGTPERVRADAIAAVERLRKLSVVSGLPTKVDEWILVLGRLPWWVSASSSSSNSSDGVSIVAGDCGGGSAAQSVPVRQWQMLVVTGPVPRASAIAGNDYSSDSEDSLSDADGFSGDSGDDTSITAVEGSVIPPVVRVDGRAAGALGLTQPTRQRRIKNQIVGFQDEAQQSMPTPADAFGLLLDLCIAQSCKPSELVLVPWLRQEEFLQLEGIGRLIMLLNTIGVTVRMPGRYVTAQGVFMQVLARDGVVRPDTALVPPLTAETPGLLRAACVSTALVSAVFKSAAALFNANPWRFFALDDTFRVVVDDSAAVFVGLQNCQRVGNHPTESTDHEQDTTQDEGFSDSCRVADLCGVCISSLPTQLCSCPLGLHCACGFDRRAAAPRTTRQRWLWYGSDTHLPCEDLDAIAQHNFEVAHAFPIPMNVVTTGWGQGKREFVRPSAPELKMQVNLLRVLAAFTAQLQRCSAGSNLKAGVSTTIDVEDHGGKVSADIVWGKSHWKRETWSRFGKPTVMAESEPEPQPQPQPFSCGPRGSPLKKGMAAPAQMKSDLNSDVEDQVENDTQPEPAMPHPLRPRNAVNFAQSVQLLDTPAARAKLKASRPKFTSTSQLAGTVVPDKARTKNSFGGFRGKATVWGGTGDSSSSGDSGSDSGNGSSDEEPGTMMQVTTSVMRSPRRSSRTMQQEKLQATAMSLALAQAARQQQQQQQQQPVHSQRRLTAPQPMRLSAVEDDEDGGDAHSAATSLPNPHETIVTRGIVVSVSGPSTDDVLGAVHTVANPVAEGRMVGSAHVSVMRG
jgi:hypothetical protein